MAGCDGLLLIQAPDVELVNGLDSRDLAPSVSATTFLRHPLCTKVRWQASRRQKSQRPDTSTSLGIEEWTNLFQIVLDILHDYPQRRTL